MLQMDLPHLNVITKLDLLHTYDPLPFNLDFYTEVHDLQYLLPSLEAELPSSSSKAQFKEPGTSKWSALNTAIIDLIQDFGLVSFETLAVEDRRSMMHLLQAVDRAGGYAFGGAEGAGDGVWQTAMREQWGGVDVADVQERWIDRKEEWDEIERKRWEEEGKAWRGEGVEEMDEDEDDGGLPMPLPDSGVKVVRKSAGG